MVEAPLTKIFQDMTLLIKDIGLFGEYVLSLFGVPATITIGTRSISSGGIFSAIITVISFIVLSRMFSEYIKWIAIGSGILFILSLISSFI